MNYCSGMVWMNANKHIEFWYKKDAFISFSNFLHTHYAKERVEIFDDCNVDILERVWEQYYDEENILIE